MLSGGFSPQGLAAECPAGFHKVCEGSTAVLFPPAMIRGGGGGGPSAEAGKGSSSTAKPVKGDDNGNGDGDGEDQAVFYNPAQVVNRDLSVCAIQLFANLRKDEPRRKGGTGGSGITILEALSATGLRAIRYFKEITGVRYIIANDLDSDAVDCIRRNCAFNGVPTREPGIHENFPSAADAGNTFFNGSGSYHVDKAAVIPNLDDAVDLMHRLGMNQSVHHHDASPPTAAGGEVASTAGKRMVLLADPPPRTAGTAHEVSHMEHQATVQGVLQQELMDVVDLDPYGTASPFLDAAFGCIKEGGLMLVTSTDSAILCGNYIDTCHAKYNAVPHKGSHCHEMAVRILLGHAERVANKHKKYIVPLLSLHIDFYVRCFFRVYTQPAEVKLSPCKLVYQLQCSHCPAFWLRALATAAPRITKAARKAAVSGEHRSHKRRRGADPIVEGDAMSPSDNNSSNNKDKDNAVAGGGGGEEEVVVVADLPPPERLPPIPARQDNPKLQCLTLQRFPALHFNPTSGEMEKRTTMAKRNSDSSRGGEEEHEVSGHGSCPVCGVGAVVLSGPLYGAPTQSREFLEPLAALVQQRDAAHQVTATARLSGLIQLAHDELDDCPLFYNLPDIASYVKTRCPPTPDFVSALGRLGYRCSQVHCCAAGIKTDCPPEILFSVMLTWKERYNADHDGSSHGGEDASGTTATGEARKRPPPPAPQLLVKAFQPSERVDFSYDAKMDFRGKVTGKAKFVPNAPGWGPKRRHQGARNNPNDDEEAGEDINA